VHTLTQRKQFALDNHFPVVLTNFHVVEQMQEAIVGCFSNVWYRSNIAGETRISYLTYDYINKKVYGTITENIVTHITRVTLKGDIPEEQGNEFINYAPIIRNIEIGNNKSKKKQKKLTQLMTTMGLFMQFSSYYLLYLIDRFGFVIDDVTEMSVFYGNNNGLFTKFTIQLMEERMKGIEQKNDRYGTF
jgi:hypothetical protein